jgi:hypothetical protein
MTFRIAGTAATLLAAAGMASLAEIALRRRSADIFGWNESFLIGAGICAAVLFPLSILAPHGALDVLAFSILLAAAVIPIRVVRALRAASSERRRSLARGNARDIVIPAFAAVVIGLFWILSLRTAFAWDGFQIWATKAFLLFKDRALRPELWPGSVYEGRSGRTVGYPPLVPLFEALTARIVGNFEFLDLKAVFVVFFASLLISTAKAARAVVASIPGRLALMAMIASLPIFTSRPMVGGNADLAVAAVVAAVAAAWLCRDSRDGRWNSPVPWLLGTLLTAKSEGLILFLVAAAAAGVLAVAGHRTRRDAPGLGGILVAAAFLADRVLYLRWTSIPDRTIEPIGAASLLRAFRRIPEVARLCGLELVRIPQWGLFWPAFGVASVIALSRACRRQKAVALASLLGLLSYSSLFLLTNWPVELHVAQAYGRLLAQLAPAAGITLLAGYRAAWTPAGSKPDLPRPGGTADRRPASRTAG